MDKVVDTTKNGAVDAKKLRDIESKYTAVIQIGSATFFVDPEKNTLKRRERLIRELERSRACHSGL